jgi:hydroxymethylbilane synthase
MARRDLQVVPLRGNVETRLRKLAEGAVDATLLAVAGLKRLGLAHRLQAVLEPEEMLPAVAQGAIGVETRIDDDRTMGLVRDLDDPATRLRITAERALLAGLDGSCRTPIAALAELDETGATLRLRSLIALPDGSAAHRDDRRGPAADAEAIGRAAALALKSMAGPEFFRALG